MKLDQSFEVQAPVQAVWEALIDIERVAPCLPGAEIEEQAEDGVYRGAFNVKLGPTSAAYRGQLKMESLDASRHVAVMRASGQDKRGQGTAEATITSRLTDTGDGTRVDVDTDFTITGRLARFGRGGMIQDVANRLLRDFATCLQATLEQERTAPTAPSGAREPESQPAKPVQAKPVRGFSVFLSVLWQRLRRRLERRRATEH